MKLIYHVPWFLLPACHESPACNHEADARYQGNVMAVDYFHEVAMSEDRADTANLLKAIEFASRKHSTQRRKDKDASPYINHPIMVSHLLADIGGVTDLVTLMAAVLHDTIEDTETTAEELEAQFGRTVRKVVEEMTDDKSLEKADASSGKSTTRRSSHSVRRPSNWRTRSPTCRTSSTLRLRPGTLRGGSTTWTGRRRSWPAAGERTPR